MDPHRAQRCGVLGVKPRQVPGAGAPGGRQEQRTEPGWVWAEWPQPWRLCCRGSWARRDAFLRLSFQFWALQSCPDPDHPRGSPPEVGAPPRARGGGMGLAGWYPGSILTPCLVSCPRGAVLHVNGRAKCHSGTWGHLQNNRSLQVSPHPRRCRSCYCLPGALASITSFSLSASP